MPNNGYWQGNPVNLDISRSKFKMPHRWTGTFDAGQLVPICAYSDILPGDTVKLDISSVVRSITPLVPVMDDAYLDIEAYFVPHKLTLSRKYMSPDVNDSNRSFAAVMGAQDSLLNMPLPANGTCLPALRIADVNGSLGRALGIPVAGDGDAYFVNCLEVLAYYSVWNEYFREPNTQEPVTYSIGQDADENDGVINCTIHDAQLDVSSYWFEDLELKPVSRFHGYFGSALPWPQRNSTSVTIPLSEMAPVVTGKNINDLEDYPSLKWVDVSDGIVWPNNGYAGDLSAEVLNGTSYTKVVGNNSASFDPDDPDEAQVAPGNLYADLASASAISINQLRYLFATQKYYEALARGGNRLEEMSQALFGVRPNDAASNIPEYLGGKRIPLSMTQVNSTAGGTTSAVSQATLGSTGAFSLTNSSDYLFTKSFDTWGTIMIVACVRVKDSFSQGVPRRNRRFTALDFYNPKFANIGEQPIYKEELFVNGDDIQGGVVPGNLVPTDNSSNRQVFGYQEAWADYRYFPDIVTGQVVPGGSMGYWTYANNFAAAPTLKSFLNASTQYKNIDRTLQVPSTTAGFQFIGQFLFNFDMVRPMPLYSIPGLIDHH